MHAKNFIVNDNRHRQVIHDLRTHLPYIDRPVLLDAFIIEPIDLRNLPALVITSYKYNSIFKLNFETYQQQKGLNWVITAIDEVAEKYIAGPRAFAANFEQLDQIVKLPVYVSAYSHWRGDIMYVFLLSEDGTRHIA